MPKNTSGYDRYLIAPFKSGLENYLKPWLTTDDSMQSLENAYSFRGSIRKRVGSILMGTSPLLSRLRILVGTTNGSGALTVTVPGTIFEEGQMFSIGNDSYMVELTGTPAFLNATGPQINVGTTSSLGAASGTVPGSSGTIGQFFLIGSQIFFVVVTNGALNTSGPGSGTFNTTTGAFTFTGAAPLTTIYFVSTVGTFNTSTGQVVFTGAAINTAVFYYPAQPVMGLTTFEDGPINNQPSYGFDTQFAYTFNGGGWIRSGTGVTPIWHGDDLNFFWTENWVAAPGNVAMFVTNFSVTNYNGPVTANDDPIWWLDAAGTWTQLDPITLVAGNYVSTCKLIVRFHNRLVLFNTVEVDSTGTTNTNYTARARWSTLNDPTAANQWLEIGEVGSAGASFLDATTDEQIVSVGFIKDRCIVNFERSTFEFAWTSNDAAPYQWLKLNSELGSESTFSVVGFDQEALAIGSVGVHACNGSNVQRIDRLIPDKIFKIKNSNASTLRVCGIRDYYNELVYWAYPSINVNVYSVYNNKILVYNYVNKSWAEFDDAITAWGYFEQEIAPTWQNVNSTWEQYTASWNSGIIQSQATQVMGGNQQGFTFLMRSDIARNAPALSITNMNQNSGQVWIITVQNHTLQASSTPLDGDYVAFENIVGLNGVNGLILPVLSVVSENEILVIMPLGITGTYLGGGTLARVSNIKIASKQWNPYDAEGSDVYLGKIDFAVQRTSTGQIQIDYMPSSSQLSMVQGGLATGAQLGSNVLELFPYNPNLYPMEQYQEKLWHSIYFGAFGNCIQISAYMTDAQLRNPSIAWSNFELQGMILYTKRVTRIM